LFFGTTIAVTILVLAKNKTDTAVQFIDATGEDFFRKGVNINIMDDRHIAEIMRMFDSKENVPHVAETVSYGKIADAEYNLSVSAYVEPKDTREVVDIKELNSKIVSTVARIDELRSDIDAIVAEIEA